MVANEGGQGQYSVSILESTLGSGGWAAGNLEDLIMLSPVFLFCGDVESKDRKQ